MDNWKMFASKLFMLLTPIVLLFAAIRLLLLPAFVNIEYNLPYFPADPYGLTKEQRLELAPIALDYLLNDEGIDFLGDLEFDGGAQVYNARELKHMEDVKN
ncbi:MAG: TIGR01906 family membrane protein, partial [Anaerolineae bacterium]|nr:TIGR01906 family membrane protein [Anaerolineae bacterium]